MQNQVSINQNSISFLVHWLRRLVFSYAAYSRLLNKKKKTRDASTALMRQLPFSSVCKWKFHPMKLLLLLFSITSATPPPKVLPLKQLACKVLFLLCKDWQQAFFATDFFFQSFDKRAELSVFSGLKATILLVVTYQGYSSWRQE